jgi:hypothetical protein
MRRPVLGARCMTRRSAGARRHEGEVSGAESADKCIDESRYVVGVEPERTDAHGLVPERENDDPVGVMPRHAKASAFAPRVEIDIAVRR